MSRGHRSRGGTNKHLIHVGPLPGIKVSSLYIYYIVVDKECHENFDASSTIGFPICCKMFSLFDKTIQNCGDIRSQFTMFSLAKTHHCHLLDLQVFRVSILHRTMLGSACSRVHPNPCGGR